MYENLPGAILHLDYSALDCKLIKMIMETMNTLTESSLSGQDEGEADPASHIAGIESLKRIQGICWRT